jgi:glycosyltransferase involved in cell wall biosynthesis
VDIKVIPAALDTSFYSPRPDSFSESYSPGTFTIGYGGALSGRKGWELFHKFLNTYNEKLVGSSVIVFGAPITDKFYSRFYDVKQAGRIKNEKELVNLYREMNVLLFPSTLETFGLIAQEAQSCGVPVICIRNTGTEDIVEDGKSGYAIEGDLEKMIETILILKQNPEKLKSLAQGARNRAVALWSKEIVAKQYANLYQSRIRE